MKTILLLIFALATCLALASASNVPLPPTPPPPPDAKPLDTKATVLDTLDPDCIEDTLTLSPDSKRLAYVARRGDKAVIFLDSKPSKPYDLSDPIVNTLVFSPDSKRFAYTAAVKGKEFAVIDGIEGKPYDAVIDLAFSPDSSRTAYAAQRWDKWLFVIDGRETQPYDDIAEDNPIFSPDSKHVVYSAAINDKWLLVVNGIEVPSFDFPRDPNTTRYEYVGIPTFSPDSKRFACVVDDGKLGSYVLTNDGQGKEYLVIGDPGFSPDSKHLFYIATTNDNHNVLLVDHKALATYDHDNTTALYSPDTSRFACAAHKNDKLVILLDGKEQTLDADVLEVQDIAFSPDSKHFAALIESTDGQYILLDGVKQKSHNIIYSFAFSPDSNHVACIVSDGRWCVTLDGVEGPKYDAIYLPSLTFSPDSKHLAYVASYLHEYFLVLDNHQSLPCSNYLFNPITFTAPDTCSLAIPRRTSTGQTQVIVLQASAPGQNP